MCKFSPLRETAVQKPILISGKPAEVLDALRALIAARKPQPKVIYQTTIITPGCYIWKKVPIVGRVPT